jgi:ankyrin repeat protein
MEALLNEGADVNACDRWGQTALQEAILGNHEHSVQLLLKWQSKMYMENGAASLCTAASEGNVELVYLLLKKKLKKVC